MKPVNPNATEEAKTLLKYLYNIQGKTLSGQHNFMGRLSESSDSVKKIVGDYPAIWGSDFGFADSTHDIDNIEYRALIVPEIIKQHGRGCIITMTYHQANPAIGEPCQFKGGVISDLTNEQWDSITTQGTPLYNKWEQMTDMYAEHLKKVQEANIPILFRPYHEMNGHWFWWGGRPGKEGFIKLWKQLYGRYTNYHKLNNLLWVWSTDRPWEGIEEYYPGHDYVDVLGSDIYPLKDTNVVYRQEWYDRMFRLADGKPLALTEHSILPTDEQLKTQPWVWFMAWADLIYKRNTIEQIKHTYESDQVLTLKDMN